MAPGEVCPHCGVMNPLERLSERQAREQSGSNSPVSGYAIVAYVAAAAMFLGVFLPIVRIPVAGSVNYFQNGQGDGVLIIGCALIAAALAASGKSRLVWLPGLASAGILVFTFFMLQTKLAQARNALARDLAGNPFRGIGEAAIGSIQLQWGWGMLALAAFVLIALGWSATAADYPKEPVSRHDALRGACSGIR